MSWIYVGVIYLLFLLVIFLFIKGATLYSDEYRKLLDDEQAKILSEQAKKNSIRINKS